MTNNDRYDAGSARLRALFACGTVLGACLGFAAGHISVWTRVSSWPHTISADGDEPGTSSRPADALHGFPPFDGSDISGSADLTELSVARNTPRPFFAKDARRLIPSPSVDMTAAQQPIRVTTELSAIGEEPDSLPPSAQAAPIDAETHYREQVTRSIIAQEIPHASAQEQDVWFDVLRGLDASDVKGILRMRKHVGGPPGGLAVVPEHTIAPLRSLPASLPSPSQLVVDMAWAETLACLRQVRDIRLHNLCNADTAGYQRLVPVMSDIGRGNSELGAAPRGDIGVRLARIEHANVPGEFHETGRALDVVIEGPGYLQVQWNGQTRLTRSGRLMIDDDRHLALATTSEPWRLDPPIMVPEDARSLKIDIDGRVTVREGDSEDETELELGTILLMTVLDSSGLRYAGGGLFEATRASGPAHRLSQGNTLRQFGLERLSQTVIRDEKNALAQVEQLIERLERATGD